MEIGQVITFTVSELMEIYPAYKELEDKDLPFLTALTVAENMDKLKTPYEVAQKSKTALIQSAIAKNDNGELIKQGDDKYKLTDPAQFARDIEALMSQEVELEELAKIKKDDLCGINIKPEKIRPIIKYLE